MEIRRIRKRKCCNCKELYHPDYRNEKRQRYCGKPECQKASKIDSQRRWRGKSENRNYFKGPEHVKRVQDWRRKNPGYSRRKTPPPGKALQDDCGRNTKRNRGDDPRLINFALQDVLSEKDMLLLGLISILTDSALQEDIVMTAGKMKQLGREIFNAPNHFSGGLHDPKKGVEPGASP